MVRGIRIFLLAVIATLCAFGDTAFADAVETRRAIADAVERGDNPAAIVMLTASRSDDAAGFEAAHFGYLLARLYVAEGDHTQAAREFQALRSKPSPLRTHASWHLSTLLRRSGDLFAERLLLIELILDEPASYLAAAARQRIAENYLETGSYDLALHALQNSGTDPGAQLARRNELACAEAELYRGYNDAARQRLAKLLSSSPNPDQPDDIALAAATHLDQLDKLPGTARLSDDEHMLRGRVFHFNRAFREARDHFEALVREGTSSPYVAEALFNIGRSHVQMREFAEAAQAFERVQEQFPESPFAADSMLQLASAYSRLSRYRESVARYERFIEKFPDDPRLDRAYLNIVDVLRDSGEESLALSRAEEIQAKFRGKTAEAQALFASVRIRFAQNSWEEALAAIDRLSQLNNLGGTSVPGGTTPDELQFLRAFTLESLRRYPEAVDAYLRLPNHYSNFHANLANDRLLAMAASQDSAEVIARKKAELEARPPTRENLTSLLRLESDAEKRRSITRNVMSLLPDRPADPPLDATRLPERARLLYGLGLFDEAARTAESELRKNPSKALTSAESELLSRLYVKGGAADRGVATAEAAVRELGIVPGDALPNELARLMFPTPFARHLVSEASQRSVDPRFLLSIMRQESLFRPNAKSNAAARGLMQFIPETAAAVALQLEVKDFSSSELYDPHTSIRFGSHYVASLFRDFPNQPHAVAAGYNAGEDNMRRWYNRSRSELPERYVAEIAFSQSKDYVWKVMNNYRAYQLLYDGGLNVK